jgi:CRP-like cAMP-binding protein
MGSTYRKLGEAMPKKVAAAKVGKVRQKPMPKAIRAFHASPEICTELQRIGTHRTVPSGAILFQRGEQNRGLFVVTSGRFALSSGDEPADITRIAETDCILGLPATVRDAPYSLTAQAVTEAEISVISPGKFRELLKNNPTVGMAILAILADEVFEMRRIFVFQA